MRSSIWSALKSVDIRSIPIAVSALPRCVKAFSLFSGGPSGKRPTHEQIPERTPSRPSSSDIWNDIDPTQCAITCTVSAPVSSRTVATAAGQSCVAISSTVKLSFDASSAGLAR